MFHTLFIVGICVNDYNVTGRLPECLTAETEYWTKSNVSKIQSLVVPLFEQIKNCNIGAAEQNDFNDAGTESQTSWGRDDR